MPFDSLTMTVVNFGLNFGFRGSLLVRSVHYARFAAQSEELHPLVSLSSHQPDLAGQMYCDDLLLLHPYHLVLLLSVCQYVPPLPVLPCAHFSPVVPKWTHPSPDIVHQAHFGSVPLLEPAA